MAIVSASAPAAIANAVPSPSSTFSTIADSWSPITRKIPPSRISSTVRQFSLSDSRWRGESIRGACWLVARPARTAATRPEAPTSSAGTEARNGTVNDSAVLTDGSSTRARTHIIAWPTTNPIATATAIANTKSPSTPPRDTEVAAPAIAVRRITSAVASLSRPSPSRTAVIRPETPRRLTIVVATASVGLTIAPSAIPQARSSPGITAEKNSPSSTALSATSAIDRPRMAPNSRRKTIGGIETAAE